MSTDRKPTRNVTAADLELAGGLQDVEVGDWVWIEHMHPYDNSKERRLTKITGIGPKGRLYICMETATDLLENWRYGFDPLTGKAWHYDRDTMVFATQDEIAAELARLTEEDQEEQRKSEARRQLHLAQEAAPELLDALRTLYRAAFDHLTNAPGCSDALEKAERTIARATGK
jgi:hypothetical protein